MGPFASCRMPVFQCPLPNLGFALSIFSPPFANLSIFISSSGNIKRTHHWTFAHYCLPDTYAFQGIFPCAFLLFFFPFGLQLVVLFPCPYVFQPQLLVAFELQSFPLGTGYIFASSLALIALLGSFQAVYTGHFPAFFQGPLKQISG